MDLGTSLFLFGTLRHLPLLEVVLGRDVAALDLAETELPDHEVSAVAHEPFPTIEARNGATAIGICVRGLQPADIARLNYYEGSFAYDLHPVTLKNGDSAEVYMPQPGQWEADGPWSLARWVQDHGEMSIVAAMEVMGYFGQRSLDQVARMFPMIRARAASTVRARQSKHGRGTLRGAVDIRNRTRSYARFFALDDIELRHARFDGTMSETLDRAVFVAADAAIVLPYDPVRDRVLLVEQVRLGPIGRGDKTCWQVEPIAGRIDPGETPAEAARREAREEAGLDIHDLEAIAEIYPSPGNSTEFYYLYLALADLPDIARGVGGLESEDEDICSHLWSFDELMDRVGQLDVANAPLVTCAYYLAHHRDRLRSAKSGATPEVN